MFGEFCKTSCPGCMGTVCDTEIGCRNPCLPGYYGKLCEQSCVHNCYACDRMTGDCIQCNTNYTGVTCNTSCTDCINPYSGTTILRNDTCPNTHYGINCEKECKLGAVGCAGSLPICDKVTGSCLFGCKPGLYGYECNNLCGECYDPHSTGNYVCDIRGFCEHGCARTRYGDRCDKICPAHCGNITCNKLGLCGDGCATGYHGENCSDLCFPNCKYDTCFQHNGNCSYGCKDGYNGVGCKSELNESLTFCSC